jgi:hypothetical protein
MPRVYLIEEHDKFCAWYIMILEYINQVLNTIDMDKQKNKSSRVNYCSFLIVAENELGYLRVFFIVKE